MQIKCYFSYSSFPEVPRKHIYPQIIQFSGPQKIELELELNCVLDPPKENQVQSAIYEATLTYCIILNYVALYFTVL